MLSIFIYLMHYGQVFPKEYKQTDDHRFFYIKYLTWTNMCRLNMKIRTINFHFTQITKSVQRIPIRKRSVGPVVVEDDVSPMYGTRCVCTVWYCVSGIVAVLETQGSVIFIAWVWYVKRVSKESTGKVIDFT